MQPIINEILISAFGDGDDNPYQDLPEWIRRNNICIYCGGGKFVTIPLPIELRAFYGLGEMAYQYISGNKKGHPLEITYGLLNQMTELLPLNPLGNEGDIIKTITPDLAAPILEAYVWNKDFTGKPVWKETPFNERDPEYKRVYKGTAEWLIKPSKFFNDWSNGDEPGGDFRKGIVDWNPAKIEHLAEQYFGGMFKFYNQLGKTLYNAGSSIINGEVDDDLVVRNIPIMNRFLNEVDDRSAFYGINENYFRLQDRMEQFKYELDGIKRNIKENPIKYGVELGEIMQSDRYQEYMQFKPYNETINGMYQLMKELPDNERKEIEQEINGLKREVVELFTNP